MALRAPLAPIAASVLLGLSLLGCPGTDPEDRKPSTVVISPAGPHALVSGSTLQLSAEVRKKNGGAIAGAAVTWSSSAATIAQVSASGQVTGIVAGTATITASGGGTATSSTQVTVAPGSGVTISIRTQPSGSAVVGVALGSAPVIDVRDAAGNSASNAATPVTASLVETGASLTGTTTVTTSGGSATFNGLSLVGLAGTYTMRFSAPGLTPVSSTPIVLAAGVASRLALRTQPGAAVAGAALTVQPVVEVRDAGGNVVTSASNLVTATIASGGGTLSGTSAIAASSGVATFTNLSVDGTPGERTLRFSAAGLADVTSAPFNVAAVAGAVIVANPTSLSFSAQAHGANPPSQTIAITSGGTQPLGTLSGTIQYTSGATGWLAGSFSSFVAPATITITPAIFGLSAGTHTANVSVSAVGAVNNPVLIPVTLTLVSPWTMTFGTGNRVVTVDQNATVAPTVVVRDGSGTVLTTPPTTFVSRAPGVATVSAAGVITGIVGGQAWIVATANGPGSPTDSVLAVVPREAGGPILRADVPNVVLTAGEQITVPIVLDMRGSGKLSAATATVTWPADFFTGFLTYVSHAVGASTLNPVATINASQGIARVTITNAAGVDGPVELMRITFRVTGSGRSGVLVPTANEIVTSDLTSVTDKATSIIYPLRVR